jgi:hypothetical protein
LLRWSTTSSTMSASTGEFIADSLLVYYIN